MKKIIGLVKPSRDFVEKLFLAFFVSFLFVGVIESYKNKESMNSLILKTYKNIKVKRSLCQKTQNDYFLSFYPYAGSLTMQGQELSNLNKLKDKNISKGYEIWLTALLESQQAQKNNIEKLKSETDSCYRDLYIEYEDLAILLGVVGQYENIIKEQSQSINSTYEKQKYILNGKTKNVDLQYILDSARKGFSGALTRDKDKWIDMFNELSDLQIKLAENEKARFNIEIKTYEKLRNIFLSSIQERSDRGFIAYIFKI